MHPHPELGNDRHPLRTAVAFACLRDSRDVADTTWGQAERSIAVMRNLDEVEAKPGAGTLGYLRIYPSNSPKAQPFRR